MRVYMEITGYVKNHQNFKILFWSRESEKPIFLIFPEIFTRKIWNTGISSEMPTPSGKIDPKLIKHAIEKKNVEQRTAARWPSRLFSRRSFGMSQRWNAHGNDF